MHTDDDVTNDPAQVLVELWTDLGCPWCYLGKHRLEAAIARRPDAARFELRPRSFELDPQAETQPEPVREHLARTDGAADAQVEEMEARVAGLAAADGLPFSDARSIANTFDVHRVLQLANERSLGAALLGAVQDGYFAGTLDPFDPAELVTAAVSAGLDADEVEAVLGSDAHAEAVRADEAEARALGVTGVPFVVYDRRIATAGAQSVEGFGQALAQAVPLP